MLRKKARQEPNIAYIIVAVVFFTIFTLRNLVIIYGNTSLVNIALWITKPKTVYFFGMPLAVPLGGILSKQSDDSISLMTSSTAMITILKMEKADLFQQNRYLAKRNYLLVQDADSGILSNSTNVKLNLGEAMRFSTRFYSDGQYAELYEYRHYCIVISGLSREYSNGAQTASIFGGDIQ